MNLNNVLICIGYQTSKFLLIELYMSSTFIHLTFLVSLEFGIILPSTLHKKFEE